MFSGEWAPPCGSCCTKKYATLMQIPWRVFCKKGCNADGDTWEECVGKCTEICYKDPVLEDRQWSVYIDRSPGQDSYSLECFNACVSGCGFRFDIPTEVVEEMKPNRPSKPPPPEPEVKRTKHPDTTTASEDGCAYPFSSCTSPLFSRGIYEIEFPLVYFE